jgi:hypothetical protein
VTDPLAAARALRAKVDRAEDDSVRLDALLAALANATTIAQVRAAASAARDARRP